MFLKTLFLFSCFLKDNFDFGGKDDLLFDEKKKKNKKREKNI
jgi:hypothetical protein